MDMDKEQHLIWSTLDQQSVVTRLQSTRKTDAIREILHSAFAFRKVRDIEALEQAILSREKVMTTGIGRGVAISHGEAPELPSILVALGISEQGIEFDSVDGKPVHLLFVIANSKSKRGEYLEVLSTLTKLMRSDSVRDSVRSCTRGSEVKEMIHAAIDGMQPKAG